MSVQQKENQSKIKSSQSDCWSWTLKGLWYRGFFGLTLVEKPEGNKFFTSFFDFSGIRNKSRTCVSFIKKHFTVRKLHLLINCIIVWKIQHRPWSLEKKEKRRGRYKVQVLVKWHILSLEMAKWLSLRCYQTPNIYKHPQWMILMENSFVFPQMICFHHWTMQNLLLKIHKGCIWNPFICLSEVFLRCQSLYYLNTLTE